MTPPSPPAAAVPRPSAFKVWCHRRAWSIPVHLLLVVMGLLTIYPFVWMVSTSLKDESEASDPTRGLLPQVKYRLAEDPTAALTGLPRAQRLAYEQAAAEVRAQIEAWGAALKDDLRLNPAQRRQLLVLARDDLRYRSNFDTFMPRVVGATDYGRSAGYMLKDGSGLDLARAEADLEALVGLGLLQRQTLRLDNYVRVWKDLRFWLRTLTSLVLAMAVVSLVVLGTTMLGYALARLRFPGKWMVLGIILFAALNVVPGEAAMLPIFLFVRDLGLIGSLWSLVLWMACTGLGNTLITAGFFLSLPKEVEEAARVDGAGPWKTFLAVALPMARPIVMTVSLFAFLGAWNNFMIPLLTTTAHQDLQPLALAIFDFKGGRAHQWQLITAAATIMVIPVVTLFLILQRHIVNAIAAGAVKG